jgi:hypothetical protein
MPSLNFGDAWPWLQWVLAIAAVVAFVGGAIKVIPSTWRFVTQFVNTINSLATLPAELEKQDQFRNRTEITLAAQDLKIEEIHHEVNYNNGSSVKDAVSRLESGVAEVRSDLSILRGDRANDRAEANRAVTAAQSAADKAKTAAELVKEALEKSDQIKKEEL